MNARLPSNEELLDLMSMRAIEGLDDADQMKLDHLLTEHPECDAEALELAAAAFDVAHLPRNNPPMPKRLRDNILAQATLDTTDRERERDGKALGATFPFPWLIAAAATIIAVLAWIPDRGSTTPLAPQEWTINRLRAEATDLIERPWKPAAPLGYDGVEGEVVWSTSLQKGFMVFSGLPTNDAQRAQYQLWIVDPSRDEHPIDGGVFDMPASADGAEVVIPIDNAIRVDGPSKFVITLERPGGVVVSDGPHLVGADV